MRAVKEAVVKAVEEKRKADGKARVLRGEGGEEDGPQLGVSTDGGGQLHLTFRREQLLSGIIGLVCLQVLCVVQSLLFSASLTLRRPDSPLAFNCSSQLPFNGNRTDYPPFSPVRPERSSLSHKGPFDWFNPLPSWPTQMTL